jgi:hypothetical protein
MLAAFSHSLIAVAFFTQVGATMVAGHESKETSHSQYNIVDRATVLAANDGDPNLCQAIERSAGAIDVLAHRWKHRRRSQDQFVIAVGLDNGAFIVPAGIVVDDLNESGFSGKITDNSPNGSTETRVSCEWRHLVDWRYRDALMLSGGSVYKCLYDRQPSPIKRTISEVVPFVPARKDPLPGPIASLYSAIANGDGIDIRDLLPGDRSARCKEYRMPVPGAVGTSPVYFMSVTPAQYACIFGNAESVSVFWELGMLDAQREYPPLLLSCGFGNIETTRELLRLGLSPNCVDKSTGYTPLFIAAKKGHREVVDLLIAHSADVTAKDYGGETALHVARDAAIAAALIRGGADVNAVSESGLSVLDASEERSLVSVSSLLRRHGALLSQRVMPIERRVSRLDAAKTVRMHLDEHAGNEAAEHFDQAIGVDFGFVLPVRDLGRVQ